MDPLLVASGLLAGLALVALALAVAAGRRGRPLGTGTATLTGLLFLALAALFGTLAAATRGYRALTREEVAAVVETRPTGERAFRATFRFPDGTRRSYRLRGDQIYVDARILKWEPLVNLLGLHTAYELDRVAGRYLELAAERDSPRTVHSLGRDRPVQIVGLLERFPFLRRLVDAEYGSATFVEVDRPRRLEIRVGTDGLLIRPADPAVPTPADSAARTPADPGSLPPADSAGPRPSGATAPPAAEPGDATGG